MVEEFMPTPIFTQFLQQRGLPFERWGRGPASTPESLRKELADGELKLVIDEGGKAKLKKSVAGIDVFYTDENGIDWYLKEHIRFLKDGSWQNRNLVHSLSETIRSGEPEETAAKRGILEELQIQADQPFHPSGVETVYQQSTSYPGFREEVDIHHYGVILTREQYNPYGYVEERDGVTTYFKWHRMRDMENDPRTREANRIAATYSPQGITSSDRHKKDYFMMFHPSPILEVQDEDQSYRRIYRGKRLESIEVFRDFIKGAGIAGWNWESTLGSGKIGEYVLRTGGLRRDEIKLWNISETVRVIYEIDGRVVLLEKDRGADTKNKGKLEFPGGNIAQPRLLLKPADFREFPFSEIRQAAAREGFEETAVPVVVDSLRSTRYKIIGPDDTYTFDDRTTGTRYRRSVCWYHVVLPPGQYDFTANQTRKPDGTSEDKHVSVHLVPKDHLEFMRQHGMLARNSWGFGSLLEV